MIRKVYLNSLSHFLLPNGLNEFIQFKASNHWRGDPEQCKAHSVVKKVDNFEKSFTQQFVTGQQNKEAVNRFESKHANGLKS